MEGSTYPPKEGLVHPQMTPNPLCAHSTQHPTRRRCPPAAPAYSQAWKTCLGFGLSHNMTSFTKNNLITEQKSKIISFNQRNCWGQGYCTVLCRNIYSISQLLIYWGLHCCCSLCAPLGLCILVRNKLFPFSLQYSSTGQHFTKRQFKGLFLLLTLLAVHLRNSRFYFIFF